MDACQRPSIRHVNLDKMIKYNHNDEKLPFALSVDS